MRVTEWTFVTSSEEAWEHMLRAWKAAQKSIDFEQFVFGHNDRIIEDAGEVLMQKAREGVRVRLLLDSIGSFLFSQSKTRTAWEEAGIEIAFHRTVIPTSLLRIVPAFLRDHRKLLIIDDTEAHIGGVIIEERARSWRDTNVVLKGPIVEECKEAFNVAWQQTGKMKPMGPVVSNEGKGEFYLLGNSFRRRHKLLYQAMIRSIATARKNVYITTPYFTLTHELRRALIYACSRDVEVRLLLPRRSDNVYSDIIGRFFYRRLLRSGVRIFHYTASILHAKTMSVDGSWSTVGSCNLDWLSILLNYELNLVSTHAPFAAELEEIFQRDLAISEEVKPGMGKWWGFFDSKLDKE